MFWGSIVALSAGTAIFRLGQLSVWNVLLTQAVWGLAILALLSGAAFLYRGKFGKAISH